MRLNSRTEGRWAGGTKVIFFLMLVCNASLAVTFLHYFHYGADDGYVSSPPCRIVNPTVTVYGTKAGNDPFALARSQSFGFFYDITDEHWRRWRKIFLDHENHRYPDKPLTYNPEAKADEARPEIYRMKNSQWKGWNSYPAWYQTNYEPNFSCPFEKRVGEPMNGDGPKWVCDPHRIKKLAEARKMKDPDHPGCVVYSVGSNGDFTFELGLQKEVGKDVCEFHIFDPGNFAGKKPSKLRRSHYHRWGLGERGLESHFIGDAFHSLPKTVQLLGHEDLDVIDIFKIDCEKCEWETYKDWLSDKVPLLHQIQVEVHDAPAAKDAGAIDFFDSLERAGYLRFHKEPNIQWGPSCIEYAFIKVDKAFMKGKTYSTG